MHTINHCGMKEQIESAQMSRDDLKEAVIERVGFVVSSILSGKPSTPHKQPGVELLATTIAFDIVNSGAQKLANDFDLDLQELKDHASAAHISSC